MTNTDYLWWFREPLACGTIRYRLCSRRVIDEPITPYFVDVAKSRAHYTYGQRVGLFGAGMGAFIATRNGGYHAARVLGAFPTLKDAKARAIELARGRT